MLKRKLVTAVLLGAAAVALAATALSGRIGGQPTSAAGVGKFDLDLTSLSYRLPRHTRLCVPEQSEYCDGEQCRAVKPAIFLEVDETNKRYSRCDRNPCDTYDATFEQSGIYTVIRPAPPKHGEIKMSNDGSYVETNALGLSIYINRGRCR